MHISVIKDQCMSGQLVDVSPLSGIINSQIDKSDDCRWRLEAEHGNEKLS